MKEKSTLANIFYNSFGTMFYYGCQWLTTILIVRLSGYQDAGNYSLAMTFTAAFAIFALFNTRQYQVSDVKGEYSDKTYITSRYIAMGAAFLICAIGLLFNAYTPYQWGIILLYMVFKCVEAWVDVYHGICQKKGRMDFICYSFLMRGVLMIVSFCGLIYITGNLMYGVLAMTVSTFLVVFFYDRVMALKFVEKDRADFKALKTLMVILVPLVVVAVTNNLSISLPKYFLERYFDETVLGYYSSVATPSMIVQVGANTIFVPLITPLADKLLADDKKGFAGILKKVFLAFVVRIGCNCVIFAGRVVFGTGIWGGDTSLRLSLCAHYHHNPLNQYQRLPISGVHGVSGDKGTACCGYSGNLIFPYCLNGFGETLLYGRCGDCTVDYFGNTDYN